MSSLKFRALAVAACLGVAVGSCIAADTQRTRAEVIAEVQAARAQGTLGVTHGEDSGSLAPARVDAVPDRSRAQVVAELRRQIERGELHLWVAEDSGSSWLHKQPHESELTRAQVKAEVVAARVSGELGTLLGEDSGAFHLSRLAPPGQAGAVLARR